AAFVPELHHRAGPRQQSGPCRGGRPRGPYLSVRRAGGRPAGSRQRERCPLHGRGWTSSIEGGFRSARQRWEPVVLIVTGPVALRAATRSRGGATESAYSAFAYCW